MNAQRLSALEDVKREKQCRIWAPVMVLFIVVNIVQIVSLYFVIDQNDCEPLLINFIILDTFLNIFGSLYVLIEEHLDSREKLLGY
jgi:hypothetical protein